MAMAKIVKAKLLTENQIIYISYTGSKLHKSADDHESRKRKNCCWLILLLCGKSMINTLRPDCMHTIQVVVALQFSIPALGYRPVDYQTVLGPRTQSLQLLWFGYLYFFLRGMQAGHRLLPTECFIRSRNWIIIECAGQFGERLRFHMFRCWIYTSELAFITQGLYYKQSTFNTS